MSAYGQCWTWTGRLTIKGYAQVRYQGRYQSVHRLVYETLVGPIPAGLVIDHLCRNRACYNPAHLDPVTPGENVRRGMTGWKSDQKGACPAGHPYTDENTLDRGKGRECRACRKERQRVYTARWRGRLRDL